MKTSKEAIQAKIKNMKKERESEKQLVGKLERSSKLMIGDMSEAKMYGHFVLNINGMDYLCYC